MLWASFLAGVLVMITIDLRVSAGKAITPKKAAVWTGVWVSLSLAFAGFLFWRYGAKAAGTFLTAYVIEYALSVDNLFVFLVIFGYFNVKPLAQHRLLYWGILGAFAMRGALIFAGTALVAQFTWLLYLFGAFLLYTAYKLLFAGTEDETVDPETSAVLRLARKVLPVSTADHGVAFTAKVDGRRMVTMMFLVLVLVESSDLLFALDSIPAVLGISQDPFIVFSSNACAILGLRSLFFVVSSLMDKFRYLKVGLGIILGFVGVKLIVETAFHEIVFAHETLLIVGSLSFIAVTLTASILASVLIKPKHDGHAGLETPQAKDSQVG